MNQFHFGPWISIGAFWIIWKFTEIHICNFASICTYLWPVSTTLTINCSLVSNEKVINCHLCHYTVEKLLPVWLTPPIYALSWIFIYSMELAINVLLVIMTPAKLIPCNNKTDDNIIGNSDLLNLMKVSITPSRKLLYKYLPTPWNKGFGKNNSLSVYFNQIVSKQNIKKRSKFSDLLLVSMTPVTSLYFLIPLWIFIKNWNSSNKVFRTMGESNLWTKTWSCKISSQTPFKANYAGWTNLMWCYISLLTILSKT